MLDSIKRSVSGLVAQMHRLTAIGNNIANATTLGYKRSEGSFSELLMEGLDESNVPVNPTGQEKLVHGVEYRPETLFTQGGLMATSRALDVAIDGPGFIELIDSAGQALYSRGGSFTVDQDGQLVHSSGAIAPGINIHPRASLIEIDGTGAISFAVDGNVIEAGRLRLMSFVNPSGLKLAGHNTYVVDANSGNPEADNRSVVKQGFLETSNVSLVDEMTSLLRAQRAYQTNAKALRTMDEMWEKSTSLRR